MRRKTVIIRGTWCYFLTATENRKIKDWEKIQWWQHVDPDLITQEKCQSVKINEEARKSLFESRSDTQAG